MANDGIELIEFVTADAARQMGRALCEAADAMNRSR
jgi:hypothetical protein